MAKGDVIGVRYAHDLSDVDVLVEFEAGRTPGLFGAARMERELSERFGRKVDLRTPQDLSLGFRDQVVATALIQYESR